MTPDQTLSFAFTRERLPFLLTLAAVTAGMVSIAASHLLLGAAVASLLFRRDLIRVPPIGWALLAFLLWTIASLALSDYPAAGLPQIRKFYVWLVLIVVYSAVRRVAEARALLLAIVAGAAASAAWSMVQFVWKYSKARELGQPFYQAYVADRITGFMSHWMTFGGLMMLAALVLTAFVLIEQRRAGPKTAAAGLLLSLAIVLGLTRSIWPATTAGLLYLVWHWRRWAVLLAPVLAAAVIVAAPEPVSTRVRSIWQPSRLDSNLHRDALRRTGWEMIRAHPLFGVGPEQVGPRFLEYAPKDIPRPLPSSWWVDHLHNIYFHYAAERGLPALMALLWLLGKAILDFYRAVPEAAPERRWILHAAVACIIGILVSGWGEVNLGDSEVLSCLLAIVACGYVAVLPATAATPETQRDRWTQPDLRRLVR